MFFTETLVRYLFLYGLCILMALALLPKSEAETIRVNKYTFVSGQKDLYLTDILDTRKMSSPVKQAIAGIKITNAPNQGERRILSSRSLSQILRKHLGSLKRSEELTFKIPNEVIIENATSQLRNESAKEKLRYRWQSFCQKCRFEVDMLKLPQLEKGLEIQSWQIAQVQSLPKGSFTYPLILTLKSGEQKKYWVQGQARVFRRVPVAKHHLNFGQTLLSDDVELKERDITYAFDEPANLREVQGQLLKRTLPAGHVIWQGSVERPRAVRRGQPVRITLEENGWALTLQGVAQEAGRIGEDITVRNPKSNKLLSGRITADGEVLVQ